MSRPTDQLVREHEHILALLNVLERLGELVTSEGASAPLHAIERALEFLRVYADGCHHGKEEQCLFPAMHAAGMPREAGPIAVMLAEHEEGREQISEMAAALEGLRAKQPSSGPAFGAAAARYVALLRHHILKENQVLFPMAEDLLGEVAKAELLQRFAAVERDDVGADVVAQLLADAEALAAEHGAAARD